MADYVNTATLAVELSVNSHDAPWVTLPRADALVALAIPQQYRKWTGSAVAEMTAPEKAAVDAAALTASRAVAAAELDRVDSITRSFMLLVLDELNAHAAKINAILTAIDGAASLGALKTAVALIADYPTRTAAQLRNAIAAKLGT